jgi:hypothetical protein
MAVASTRFAMQRKECWRMPSGFTVITVIMTDICIQDDNVQLRWQSPALSSLCNEKSVGVCRQVYRDYRIHYGNMHTRRQCTGNMHLFQFNILYVNTA